MSSLKTFEVSENGNVYNFSFYCASRNTRHGFAHDCDLFVSGNFAIKATCHYLNRTWECYQYQSVMLSAVSGYRDHIYECAKSNFMLNHGYKRMTETRKKELEVFLFNDESCALYRALCKLKDDVYNARFPY